MNKKKHQAITLLSVLIVMIAFFIAPIMALAATVNYTKVANYISTWHIKSMGGLHWTDDGVYMIKANNEPAFCIEHGVMLNGGSDFTPSEMTSDERERLSLIAHYGYQVNPSVENYGITQSIIWEEYGDELLSTQLPNYGNRKKEILEQVNRHHTKPSFHNQTVELMAGESVTLTDTQNVLPNYGHLLSNTANLKVEKNGNTLKLTATKDSKESGKLQYGIVPKDQVGQSFVYKKPGEQTVATFKLSNAGEMNLNIKVNLNGHVKIQKVDEDTGLSIPNTKMKLEYNGLEKEVVTDKNGQALLEDIQAGTRVIITEIIASDGFVNKGESKEVVVEPNKTIEVIFNNKAQQGLLKMKKTGQKASSVTIEESDFGELHQIHFDFIPLANVVFDIQAAEDIKVGSHIHTKQGEIVATVKTDDQGSFSNMPKLYLGKYEAVEKEAPTGFLFDDTPIPFEFTYGGQEIELVSESVEVKNEFQRLNLLIHKNEETISDWEGNQPIIEEVPGEGKTFGLFTNQEFLLEDETIISADALLAFDSVFEGKQQFSDMHLPEGQYYVRELVAGEHHILDDKKYEFEFIATDYETEKTIHIYSSDSVEEAALLNQLHFNQFGLKKVNEDATLFPKEGYEFQWTGNGAGAVFTLETAENQVIQTVKTEEDSIALFENIPVGTFYLKETQPSSEKYVLSTETFTILSIKEGVQIFSESGELVGSSIAEDNEDVDIEDELIVLFEVRNHLIKGTAELTKKDVTTGELLSSAGIRLLNENKKVIFEGKTNEKGLIEFSKLPAGRYYFQEFSAPEGYQLDTELIPFEITKDGEVVKKEMTNARTPNEKSSLPQTGERNQRVGIWLGGLCVIASISYFAYRKLKEKKKLEK